MADSAVRAGFAVTTIDAFADRDMPSAVTVLSLPRERGVSFSPQAAARAAAHVPCEAVAYASNFENHPDAVDALAVGRTLWGNPPSVLRRVRDPWQLADALRLRGIPAPVVRMHGSNGPNDSIGLDHASAADPNEPNSSSVPIDWLVKPLSSGGGHGVRRWTGERLSSSNYLQQRVQGVPGSLVFVAAGGRAVPLGMSRQLIGDRAFGADGYRYCGNILAPAGDRQFEQDEALVDAASGLARAAAEDFSLVGLNGIDFVAADGVPHPIEVNPRWCASMELVECAYGVSMFGAHVVACVRETVPVFDLATARREAQAVGKAIVFAHRDVTMGDVRLWLDDPTVRDVPHAGEPIATGQPICTVLAHGTDSAVCYAALVRRAERVYAALG